MGKKEIQKDNKFTKEQFLKSKSFLNDRDIINAVLENGKSYTKKDVEEKILNFKKGKVI